jgi:PHP family Zn ribbon phosphoesterase
MPEIIIDLHTHSKYAQATSKNLDLAHMEAGCRQKGIHVFGTGDFTHPLWQKELATLQESNGLGFSRTGFPFMFTTEISLIYKDKGKVHKTHNLVLAPSLDVVHQITEWLLTKGRVDYDGRPIFKISCPEFVESLRSISPDVEVIPAHIWTPWFSLFGSNSGWDRLSDCFEDQTRQREYSIFFRRAQSASVEDRTGSHGNTRKRTFLCKRTQATTISIRHSSNL